MRSQRSDLFKVRIGTSKEADDEIFSDSLYIVTPSHNIFSIPGLFSMVRSKIISLKEVCCSCSFPPPVFELVERMYPKRFTGHNSSTSSNNA
jgi:hypothetical protein